MVPFLIPWGKGGWCLSSDGSYFPSDCSQIWLGIKSQPNLQTNWKPPKTTLTFTLTSKASKYIHVKHFSVSPLVFSVVPLNKTQVPIQCIFFPNYFHFHHLLHQAPVAVLVHFLLAIPSKTLNTNTQNNLNKQLKQTHLNIYFSLIFLSIPAWGCSAKQTWVRGIWCWAVINKLRFHEKGRIFF